MLTKAEVLKIKKSFATDDNLLAVLNALSDKNRLRIFKLFTGRSDLCVTDLAKILDISVPAVSQHLKVLEAAELIKCNKQGQFCCYAINSKTKGIQNFVKMLK